MHRNLSGEVIGCFAGESEKVLHESLEAADPLYKVAFGEETSIVVISSGGSPHDINIFSACRCLENALKVVRRNGAIILVAECPEGYGETGFHQIIRKSGGDLDLLERILRDNFSVSGFIAYRFLRAFKKADIFMVTAIPDYYVSEIPKLKIFRTANESLNYALSKLGTKSKVIVIPHGNSIIPVIREQK
ncbi:MAG: hypothetical protein QXR13_01690 [Candidatus Bathyarchaeia archaeon]